MIQFCGGTETVTGSMHLLTTENTRILIDVGLFQGHRDEFYTVNARFPFNPAELDCCVISHAHIDHCGNFPTLVKQGFKGKAYLTPSTRDLCKYILPDSGYVQEEDVKYVNKINKRRGLPERFALYDQSEAEKSLKYLRTLEYHRKLSLAKDSELTFFNAGHILGSSIPTFDIYTKRGVSRIAYAVDLGRPRLPFLKSPEAPKGVDYLIIESTYGGRTHSDIDTLEERLAKIINRTVKRGGKIIIPSFALERAQEVLFSFSADAAKKDQRYSDLLR